MIDFMRSRGLTSAHASAHKGRRWAIVESRRATPNCRQEVRCLALQSMGVPGVDVRSLGQVVSRCPVRTHPHRRSSLCIWPGNRGRYQPSALMLARPERAEAVTAIDM